MGFDGSTWPIWLLLSRTNHIERTSTTHQIRRRDRSRRRTEMNKGVDTTAHGGFRIEQW